MDDEKLIQLVMENPELYNKTNLYYKYPERKKAVWLKIAKDMGTTDEQCIRRWTSLRDRFSRECRQTNLPSGSGASSKPTWHLFESMQFLKPHIVPRPTRGSSNIVTDSQKLFTNDTNSFPWSEDETSQTSLPASSPTSILESEELFNTPAKKKSKIDIDKVFSEAVETFKSICSQNKVTINPSVKAFGDMIIATINDMNNNNQIRAMKEVTDIVMRIKLENDNPNFK